MVDVRQEAAPVDLYFRRGDYMEFPIRVPDPDNVGQFLDLSGYTFLAQVRLTADDESPGLVRSFTASTATDTSLVAIDGEFTSVDVGAAVTGDGIDPGATIATVTNPTTVELSAATTATASPVLVEVTPDSKGVIAELLVVAFTNGATDRGVMVTITDPQSRAMAAALGKKEGVWDCEFSNATGLAKPRTWFAGIVKVTKDVSRAVAL